MPPLQKKTPAACSQAIGVFQRFQFDCVGEVLLLTQQFLIPLAILLGNFQSSHSLLNRQAHAVHQVMKRVHHSQGVS